MVAVRELDLELHAREEGRPRMEDDRIRAGLEVLGELRHAAVGVGHAVGENLVPAQELDADISRRSSATGIEDVRRDRDAH